MTQFYKWQPDALVPAYIYKNGSDQNQKVFLHKSKVMRCHLAVIVRRTFFILCISGFFLTAVSQTPRSYSSSEILLQIKKLNVLGSVLYIAAHPDDENTRLLAWLANEKMYRTGYLSLTRGDGGQNLIGDEQGIDLGLIRTQELLAARRIDGAEQFFSRAYDFGYCKSPEEALNTWGHEKILGDVVWVIRKFRPDVIICRFPTTGEGGHGHHTASAILAEEAFAAAADPARFPEQLSQDIVTWQAKRILWNTFNFGGTNTQREGQLKVDVGGFNPLLGKSYGEIAALSRSQHKSQGFGVPAQRGTIIEYFASIKGEKPASEILESVNTTWGRLEGENFQKRIDSIATNFDPSHPERSVGDLVRLYLSVEKVRDAYWRTKKLDEIQSIIESCSGIFMEAVAASGYAVIGDSLKLTMTINNRLGAGISAAEVHFNDSTILFGTTKQNETVSLVRTIAMADPKMIRLTQPYWLQEKMDKGSFNVANQAWIGKGENEPLQADFILTIAGKSFTFKKPVVYKYTDPVKGELYEPLVITSPLSVNPKTSKLVSLTGQDKTTNIEVSAFRDVSLTSPGLNTTVSSLNGNVKNAVNLTIPGAGRIAKGEHRIFPLTVKPGTNFIHALEGKTIYDQQLKAIRYDHIPPIHYYKPAMVECKSIDLKTNGSNIGYIPGAGDKVPEALEQMGYSVTLLKESDITASAIKKFDAIVTGVRAYNTNEWMNNVYDVLMAYIQDGGVLLVQYNTSSQIGPVKAKIGPYPFTITRNRITDEEAKVNMLIPRHPVFNYPNKITEKDFEGWIQERSIYHAETTDSNYTKPLSMKDPGETEQDGSLIIADFGKGRFIYTGLVFFRELPAAVPGAYRLFANLIAGKRK
jgi:LmbE family N-acetylglucosaminyl deacetylase